MQLIEYQDRDLLMLNLADRIASDLTAALQANETVTFSVPGGSTPGPVLDTLSGINLEWARVNVVLNDERWVPETSDRSNTRLIKARLLRDYAAKAGLIPLYLEGATPEDRMGDLTSGLTGHLPISVLLLGMGADMHTASLFPGADRLADALSDQAPPLMPMRADAAGEPRVTLTKPVLKGAMATHILITGADKRAALDRAQTLPEDQAPIRAVLQGAMVHWTP